MMTIPLSTPDRGRGCYDASMALLLSLEIWGLLSRSPLFSLYSQWEISRDLHPWPYWYRAYVLKHFNATVEVGTGPCPHFAFESPLYGENFYESPHFNSLVVTLSLFLPFKTSHSRLFLPFKTSHSRKRLCLPLIYHFLATFSLQKI